MRWDFIQQRNKDQNDGDSIKCVRTSGLKALNQASTVPRVVRILQALKRPGASFAASFLLRFPFQWFEQSILKSNTPKPNYRSNAMLL